MSGRRIAILLLFGLNGTFTFLRLLRQIWESEQAAYDTAENPEQAGGRGMTPGDRWTE